MGGGDPSKAIIPFFAKKKRRVGVVEQWQSKREMVEVFEDYIDTPSMKTVEAYMCTASDLFTRQQTSEADGMKYEPYPRTGPDLAALINTFKIRIAGNPKFESKKCSTIDAADGGEVARLQRLMRTNWTHRYQEEHHKR
ncbi:hypothetical protein KI688_008970 [Linnemannia hyalina]|nr:hypothetical protein KI688_008970 [Linnemannia hyalina]